MSKILDMAKDFEQNSKQQANAIEKRHREASERRVHEARESYLRGVEIKRGENERRYCRAQPEHGLAVAQNVDLDAGQHRPVLERNERDPLVSGGIDSGAASQSPSLGGEGRQDKAGPVREEVGAPLRADLRFQPGRLGEGYVLGRSEGVLNDGIGAGIALRVRGFAERIRAAAQGMAGKLRELGEHVREHQTRGREQPGGGQTLDAASGRLNAASGRLEQAVGGLNRASQQVAKEREHRLLKVLERGWERGDRSRGFER